MYNLNQSINRTFDESGTLKMLDQKNRFTVVSYSREGPHRRYGKLLSILLVAFVLVSLILFSVRSIRDEISIDINSGDLRKQRLILAWTLSESVERTRFSSAARDAGLVVATPPEWRITEIKYRYRRPAYENSRAGNTPPALDELAMQWEVYGVPPAVRLEQAQRALSVVRDKASLSDLPRNDAPTSAALPSTSAP